jgi:hypothetical protein
MKRFLILEAILLREIFFIMLRERRNVKDEIG